MTDWNPSCKCLPGPILAIHRLTLLAWATKPIKQDVVYNDPQGLQSALTKLQRLPPLVTAQEVGLWHAIKQSD